MTADELTPATAAIHRAGSCRLGGSAQPPFPAEAQIPPTASGQAPARRSPLSTLALLGSLMAAALAFGTAALPNAGGAHVVGSPRAGSSYANRVQWAAIAFRLAHELRGAKTILLVPERAEIQIVPSGDSASGIVTYAARDGVLWRRQGPEGRWAAVLAPDRGRVELRYITGDGAERLLAGSAPSSPEGRILLQSVVVQVVLDREGASSPVASAARAAAGRRQ